MMLLCANPNVTAKRLNGETAIQDKKRGWATWLILCILLCRSMFYLKISWAKL